MNFGAGTLIAYTSTMAFKVFDKYGAASRQEVTLRASGYVFVSLGLLSKVGSEDSTHFQVLYDEDTCRAALDFTNNPNSNEGVWRELSREKSGVAANILPLLRHYGFQMGRKKLNLPVTVENDYLIFSLKTAMEQKEAEGRLSLV